MGRKITIPIQSFSGLFWNSSVSTTTGDFWENISCKIGTSFTRDRNGVTSYAQITSMANINIQKFFEKNCKFWHFRFYLIPVILTKIPVISLNKNMIISQLFSWTLWIFIPTDTSNNGRFLKILILSSELFSYLLMKEKRKTSFIYANPVTRILVALPRSWKNMETHGRLTKTHGKTWCMLRLVRSWQDLDKRSMWKCLPRSWQDLIKILASKWYEDLFFRKTEKNLFNPI